MDFPKVLISCPTAVVKNYCFEAWLKNVMNFTYPNYQVYLCDNTNDEGVNVKYYNDYYKEHYGEDGKFLAVNSLLLNNVSRPMNIIEKMALSHNDCRDATLENNFDYLFHLESDVFPPKDVVERLMFHKKNVAGGLYHINSGIYRSPMIQLNVEITPKLIGSINLETNMENIFIDGQLLQVAHVGLGCVLISKKVLQKLKFRSVNGVNNHPDSFFAEDCYRYKIPIWIDSSIVCSHDNQDWGIYGLDFK
jgi:hypothetical protein